MTFWTDFRYATPGKGHHEHETVIAYIIQDLIHLLKKEKHCSIPDHFDSHACKYRAFIYKAELLNAYKSFGFLSGKKYFFLRITLTNKNNTTNRKSIIIIISFHFPFNYIKTVLLQMGFNKQELKIPRIYKPVDFFRQISSKNIPIIEIIEIITICACGRFCLKIKMKCKFLKPILARIMVFIQKGELWKSAQFNNFSFFSWVLHCFFG